LLKESKTEEERNKRIEEYEGYTFIWRGNLTERDHLKNPWAYGRIILKWVFKK
jgi:hypothetical protein